jgi:DNA mismatch repair ATPase MutS
LDRARQLLSELAVQHVGPPRLSRAGKDRDRNQMELFVDPAREIARALAATNLDQLSPIQAFELLRKLKDQART